VLFETEVIFLLFDGGIKNGFRIRNILLYGKAVKPILKTNTVFFDK
jgi:hypothetical protein